MRTGILIILLLCIQVGYAGVVINTTRVIFPGNQENTEIQLTNSGDMPSLVQSWVDEGISIPRRKPAVHPLWWYRR